MPIIAFALLSAASPTNAGDSWLDRCVAVIDGDTIVVARGTERVEADLEGADCPELGQPFGDDAKRFTAGMICRKIVKVQVTGACNWVRRSHSRSRPWDRRAPARHR